jgi:3-deoxy-D-manno-octulosonic-acid transferase
MRRRSGMAGMPFASVEPQVAVLLGDSLGEMPFYYAASDVAIVAGSFAPLGGQNLIEACALGKPVLVGPHTFNFAEATTRAMQAGAVFRINGTDALGVTLQNLLAAPTTLKRMGAAGKKFCAENRGSTDQVMTLVKTIIG